MSYSPNRFSNQPSRINPQASSQVSTQTLLNSLHTAYAASRPYSLDSSTSLVVNTWHTATVDGELARRAWEHARRRAEDGCIVLGSLHESTPSLLVPFIAALPIAPPKIIYTALAAIQPFLRCATPQNPSTGRHSALAATLTLTGAGALSAINLKLSTSGIDTRQGLINIPAESGYRAFDVFYYLISAASTASERDFLGLRNPATYSLLKKSETYDPPAFLPTADDAAAAEEFRIALKLIGVSGNARRDLLSILAALLKLGDTLGFLVDEDELERTCNDVAGLLDLDPEVLIHEFSTMEREVLIGGIYEALVDWIIVKANQAIANELSKERYAGSSSDSGSRAGAMTPENSDDDMAFVDITVLEISSPQLAKAVALRNIFDDDMGINAEMKGDGVAVTPAGHSVIHEMKTAVLDNEPDLGIHNGVAGRERAVERDRREVILHRIGLEILDDGFLRKLLYSVPGEAIVVGRKGRFDLSDLLYSSRVWSHLSIHPTDEPPASLALNATAWSAGSPSRQLRSWRLPEWANRRNKHLDFTADFDMPEFCNRYVRLGCKDGKDGIESFILGRGWSNGEVILGHERVWIREGAWWEAESMLDMLPVDGLSPGSMLDPMAGGYQVQYPEVTSGFLGSPFGDHAIIEDSKTNLLQRNQSGLGGRSIAPTVAQTLRSVNGGDYGLGRKGDETKGAMAYYDDLDPELADPKAIIEQPINNSRRRWVAFVWALTFWIPSFTLRYLGRMKRPDVRMAWREKVVLVLLIFLLNVTIVFYIIEFGRLLCPNYDKAWSSSEVSYHQGNDDFWVSVKGKVYDISKFWRIQHSNILALQATSAVMQPLAGMNLDVLFPLPLTIGCPNLVTDPSVVLQANDTTLTGSAFVHASGSTSQFVGTDLRNPNWYGQIFLPRMKDYYKGDLVTKRSDIQADGSNNQHQWVVINNQVYDLTNYFYTKKLENNLPQFSFLDPQVEFMVQENPGSDITDLWNAWKAENSTAAYNNWLCINNQFYAGKTDFRDTPRCQVNNYLLLAFTIILCTVILVKFLAALQLGSKRRPAAQDKFVICQVPAYTEGEDHLRKGLDSLTASAYDNKRKLICVICDGMIVGGGNDRPTPKIVLDILGVDPKIDPPALPFKSVGASSEQLNYGKVYSGLYEFEGNVVPYLVVVKVGKESEQTKAKPGNRGKRDSQILLMSFLNKVHYRAPMSPLELEMFHQINNIIGVDPDLYEFLFMVDADTMVKEDALNRLVAACANDSKIAGICGETSLENEERSWWTMIQVYEYYISHHLAKAFESLFGSVTCLPGCFCMYRIRSADKGKPLIISDKVINEYNDCEVDTLHKKNLLALGEDRYLTTLMTKHFPAMSYKFVPNACAQTAAPEKWSILLSQRRRWINSTIHNLAELVFLKDLCGFCCFSMRFVVFIDLFGTLILPATCAYLVYLIVRVATGQGQFPLISIVMLASVYGLQAIIFIIKRQWQHIGWMIIYILAFPIYSLVLPIYSFWKQDDFSWGSTRIVIGEKGNKQLIAVEDEGFDPRSIPLQRWDDYAATNSLPGRRGLPAEKSTYGAYDDGYEMDDIQSVYSSVKPASTILTGFKTQQPLHMPPESPAPYAQHVQPQQRMSSYSNYTRYTDQPAQDPNNHLMSMGNMSQQVYYPQTSTLQHQHSPYTSASLPLTSSDNLITIGSPPVNRAGGARSSLGFAASRPGSTLNLPDMHQNMLGQRQPSDAMIVEAVQACLATVDLDSVTKKSLKATVEQWLGCQLGPERKMFLDRQIDFELANM